MQRQELAELKQKRLFISLLSLLVVLGLWWVALRLTHENKSGWDNTMSEVMERDFRVAVTSIVMQAKLQGRVNRVQLASRWVGVNRQGRPYVAGQDGKPDCAAIWHQVMGLALEGASYPVQAELIDSTDSKKGRHWRCRYRHPSGQFFDYAPRVTES